MAAAGPFRSGSQMRVFLSLMLLSAAVRAEAPLTIPVHISGDPRLELRLSDGAAVCRAPCDRAVPIDPARAYVFGGDGITPSEAFQFTGGARARSFHVDAGSADRHAAGTVLAVTGGAVFFLGPLASAMYGIANTQIDDAGCTDACHASNQRVSTQVLVGYAVSIGVGAVLALWGAELLHTSRTTWSD